MKQLFTISLFAVLLTGCGHYMYAERPIVVKQPEPIVIESTQLTEFNKNRMMDSYFESCVQTLAVMARLEDKVPQRLEIQGYCVKQVVDTYPWVAKMSRFDLNFAYTRFNKILDQVNWAAY